jgi:hypothetical protein
VDLNLQKYCFNITLIIKNSPYGDDDFGSGTYKLDFENSIYRIDGGYMVIETKKNNDIVGQVFDLKTINSYKITQNELL